jgi:hypothetical protein
MSLRTYVLVVWLLYLTIFGAILAAIWPPPIPRIEALAAVVGGTLAIAWLGTVRAMQIGPDTSPRFLLASVVHGLALVATLVALALAYR